MVRSIATLGAAGEVERTVVVAEAVVSTAAEGAAGSLDAAEDVDC